MNGDRFDWHLKPKELSYWMVILFRKTNIFVWSRVQTSSGLNKITAGYKNNQYKEMYKISYHKRGEMFLK